MVDRKVSKRRYFVAFLITTAVFIIGVLLGALMNEYKTNQVSEFEQDLLIDSLNLDLQYELAGDYVCNISNIDPLRKNFIELGEDLGHLEDTLGKNDKKVLNLKKYYSVLEAKDFLLLKKLSQECNLNYTIVLFFYSNDDSCVDCEMQGYLLNYLRKKYDNIRVYSFDTDLDSPIIKSLVAIYDITGVPAVVFNEEVNVGYMDKQALEKLALSKNEISYVEK
jgi:hypothetical protein